MGVIEKIEATREARGLTQSELEQSARLAVSRISKWANGQGEPTGRQALKIARALGVPVEWLLDDEQTGEPPPLAEKAPELSYDQKTILKMFEVSGLSLDQAMRALYVAGKGAPKVLPDYQGPAEGQARLVDSNGRQTG